MLTTRFKLSRQNNYLKDVKRMSEVPVIDENAQNHELSGKKISTIK